MACFISEAIRQTTIAGRNQGAVAGHMMMFYLTSEDRKATYQELVKPEGRMALFRWKITEQFFH